MASVVISGTRRLPIFKIGTNLGAPSSRQLIVAKVGIRATREPHFTIV